MERLVISVKKIVDNNQVMPRQELIASQYFETQLLNSLLQYFYKENMAEYHSLGVLIIEWGAEAE